MLVRRCPGRRPGLRLLPVFLPPVLSPGPATRLPDVGLGKCGRLDCAPCRRTPPTTFSLPGRAAVLSSFWLSTGGTVDVAGGLVWSSSFLCRSSSLMFLGVVTKLDGLRSGKSGLFGTCKVLICGGFTYGGGGGVELATVVSAMLGWLVTPWLTRWLVVSLISVAAFGFSVVGARSTDALSGGRALEVGASVGIGVLVIGRLTSVACARDAGVIGSFKCSSVAAPVLSVEVGTSVERMPNVPVPLFSTTVTVSFAPPNADDVSEESGGPVVLSYEAGCVSPLVTETGGGSSVGNFGPGAVVSVSGGGVTSTSFTYWVGVSVVGALVKSVLSVDTCPVAPGALTNLGVRSVTVP